MAGIRIPQQPHFATMRGREADSTLVADWGPDGKDRSTSALDMTPVADAVLGGRYVTLDGTGDYLNLTTANFRSSDQAGTVVIWFRPAATTESTIFNTADTGSGNYFWRISQLSNDKVRVDVREAGSTTVQVDTDGTIPPDEWSCIVVTSDGSTLRVYLNGGAAETLTLNAGANAGQWFADVTLRDNVTIGALVRSTIAQYVNGDIANVRVYSEAKTVGWSTAEFARGVPDSTVVLAMDGTGVDRSRYSLGLTPAGGIIRGGRWVILDGTDDKLDAGDIGNIQEIAAWVRPKSTTEELFLVDTGNDIMVSSGTITYTGLTATATYVDGSAGTTLAANKWSHVVCQFSTVDANNMELGNDGANYGQFDCGMWFARTTARGAAAVAQEYAQQRGRF